MAYLGSNITKPKSNFSLIASKCLHLLIEFMFKSLYILLALHAHISHCAFVILGFSLEHAITTYHLAQW